MFQGVDAGASEGGSKRMAASTMVAAIVCAAIVAVALSVKAGVIAVEEDKGPVEVVFKAPAPKPKAPPKPAAVAKKKPTKRKRRSGKKAPNTKAPAKISDEALAEGNAADFGSTADADSLAALTSGDGGGGGEEIPAPPKPEPEPPKAPPAPPVPTKPVFVKDTSTWPRAIRGNAMPKYPKQAVRDGKQGTVVVRFLVTTEGRVAKIRVLQGKEPFVTAVLAVLKDWRFRPATVDGKPRAQYIRKKFPFELRAR